jgi:hypothetical protein
MEPGHLAEVSFRAAIAEHPVEVLEHAVKHRHVELMDKASRATIGMSMNEVRKHLSVDVFFIWVCISHLRAARVGWTIRSPDRLFPTLAQRDNRGPPGWMSRIRPGIRRWDQGIGEMERCQNSYDTQVQHVYSVADEELKQRSAGVNSPWVCITRRS